MIVLKDVYFKYNLDDAYVLSKCNAVFNTNKKILLYGTNGSGKSTLLDILTGFKKPSSGSVVYDNVDLFQSERSLNILRRLISYMPSQLFLPDNFRVKDLLSFWTDYKMIPDLIEDLNLTNSLNIFYYKLSEGFKNRVKLAITFSRGNYIFLDEPLKSQDNCFFDLFSYMLEKYFKAKTLIVSNPVFIENFKWDKVYELLDGQLYEK